jgi:triosephosphate isomerase
MLRAKLTAKNAKAAANVQILYGGSMKPDNARDLLAMADIDGGLIGGAALKAADFLAIVRAA